MRRKYMTALATLLILFFNASAQLDDYPPTTEEEYNYITKGYNIQVSSGLDMKKGYELAEFRKETRGHYTFVFKPLIRSAKRQLAAMMVEIKSAVSGKTYYLCMPIKNPGLTAKYHEDVSKFDYPLSNTYAQLLSDYFVLFAAIINENENAQRKK